MSLRVSLALEAGGLLLPQEGRIDVLRPTRAVDLGVLDPARLCVVQPNKPDHDHFAAQGLTCVAVPQPGAVATLLFLPRSKALARHLIAGAQGLVVVDGAKTDGVDSLLKDIRKRASVQGPISKAHGKVFWFQTKAGLFDDWLARPAQVAGFVTVPGVFSADGVDPASAALAQALPPHLGRRVADLGAGWGYLSARILQDTKVQSLDLVEADHDALDCARQTITDPRARFHWADATTWRPETGLDAVVMNPPFHTGRAAEPALGQAFIATAVRGLVPSGALWMVANRHLPYETTLRAHFGQVDEIGGDARFKLLRAARPSRQSR